MAGIGPVLGPVSHPPTGADSIPCAMTGAETAADADAAARTAPSWANIEAARIGPEPAAVESATAGPLRFSLGRSELARIRTASPKATKATTNP